MFASLIGKRDIGCFELYGLVTLKRPYESIKFMDINQRSWIRVRRITKIKKWRNFQWDALPVKTFTARNHRILFSPPSYGQLIYIRDRHYGHIFVRTYGREPTSSLSTTISSVTDSIEIFDKK